MRILPLSFLSTLGGVASALGGCILTIMLALANQVVVFKAAGNCVDCGPGVTLQLGYPLPWLWYGATSGFGGPILSPLRVDFWAFSADFGLYTLSLVGMLWSSGILVRDLKRRGVLERLVLGTLVIMTIVYFVFLFWWPLIF